jgi:hypothetical protein
MTTLERAPRERDHRLVQQATTDALATAFQAELSRLTLEARNGRLSTRDEQRRNRDLSRRAAALTALEHLPDERRADYCVAFDRQIRAAWPRLVRLSRSRPRRSSVAELFDRVARPVRHSFRRIPRVNLGVHAARPRVRARERREVRSRRRGSSSRDDGGDGSPGSEGPADDGGDEGRRS